MQANANLVIYYTILTSLQYGVPKTCALERFFQPQAFVTHNGLQSSGGHCSQVSTFIFGINKDLFIYSISNSKNLKLDSHNLTTCFSIFK